MAKSNSPRRNWNRQETLIAFRLYCRTPFGKLHKSNPEIIALSQLLGRTPSAIGMKACNFASLDPKQQARGIVALANTSAIDDQVWSEFESDPEAIAAEAETAYESISIVSAPELPIVQLPDGPTEIERIVRTRRVQAFFRAAVMASYRFRCAVTGLDVPELLNASHIVPWSVSVEKRGDPRNGLCLNVLLDRAFDRGLITFADDLSLMVSRRVAENPNAAGIVFPNSSKALRLTLPSRFQPDQDALQFHRTRIFQA